jgi:hypothetical protein
VALDVDPRTQPPWSMTSNSSASSAAGPHPPTGGNVPPLALLHGVPVPALGGSGYLPAPVADPGGHIGESA